ncbi:MAG: ubiquinol-cytochrome c reductase iron-sulfur subunit [Actinobacteria bacterium]|nr:ubiquinol-cytochrome c reductase iron-sulfur subunit [Actinomycetota bacterium]
MADTKLGNVKRRDFLRVGLVAGTVGSLGAFGAAALGFMWPTLGEGFGAQIAVGNAEEIAGQIGSERAPVYYAPGRLYVVTWDPNVPGAEAQYGEDHVVLDSGVGLMALYQKCVHLGCKVPWCQSSQWFECPCHGSKYNKYGEWMDGPAPRGLDRFPSTVDDSGQFVANTGVLRTGPARTARVLQQEPEGPHCVDL